MIKARIILGLLAATIVALQFPLSTIHLSQGWEYVPWGVSLVLFVAAVSIITFSFFRVHETLAGDLCFDASNPLWKLMLWLNGNSEEKPLKGMSLCATYWATVFTIVMASAMLGILSFFLGVLIPGAFREFMKDPAGNLKIIGLSVFGFAAAVLIIFGIGALCEKHKAFGKIMGALAIACAICFLLFILAIAPVLSIESKRHISTTAAIQIYLHYAMYVVGAVAGASLLLIAAFRYIPVLKNTWLGRIFGRLKKNFCPQLTAYSHA